MYLQQYKQKWLIFKDNFLFGVDPKISSNLK